MEEMPQATTTTNAEVPGSKKRNVPLYTRTRPGLGSATDVGYAPPNDARTTCAEPLPDDPGPHGRLSGDLGHDNIMITHARAEFGHIHEICILWYKLCSWPINITIGAM